MLIYYPFFEDKLSAQLLSTDDRMKLLDNTASLCADLEGGNYTYLDISDGVNLEVVKATGCEDGCILIERDQLGTGAYSFGIANTCVTFSNKAPTIKDIICDLLANVEEDCGEGATPWICNITANEEYISITDDPENPCGKIITFNPGAFDEYQLCAEPDLEVPLDNAHKMAVCVNEEVYLTTLQDICAFILSKISATPDYVENLIPGAGIDIIGTGGTRTISLEVIPGFVGVQTLTGGAQVNQYGQFIHLPSGWPFGTGATLPNGVYTNATVTVSGGVITGVVSGAPGGGVNSVSVPVPGGLVDSGTPADPAIGIALTGVTAGTYGALVINDKGQITQVLSGYNFYKDITATAPLDATPAGDNQVISHNDSGITPGTYGGITFDVKGHATDADVIVSQSQWIGTATAFSMIRETGLTSSAGAAGVVDFLFDLPLPDTTYHVEIGADIDAITYTISGRTTNGFSIDFSAQTNVFYVTVTYLA